MINKFTNWISAKFQFITVGLLVFAITLIVKQQNDISRLKRSINQVDFNIYNLYRSVNNLDSSIEDVEWKLDDVEKKLSREIEDVKSTVRIWSN